jgi:hypothetical protein
VSNLLLAPEPEYGVWPIELNEAPPLPIYPNLKVFLVQMPAQEMFADRSRNW